MQLGELPHMRGELSARLSAGSGRGIRSKAQCLADYDGRCPNERRDRVELGTQDGGIFPTRMSRAIPPPVPVSTPSSTAPTGLRSNARALDAPDTAKTDSPTASNTMTGFRTRLRSPYPKKVINPWAASSGQRNILSEQSVWGLIARR